MSKLRISDKSEKVYDGMMNIVSGMGTSRDRSTSSKAIKSGNVYGWAPEEMEAMYSDHAIARKIIDIIPEDMCKNWRKFDDKKMDSAATDAWVEMETEHEIRDKVLEAMRWARLYGSSAIIPVYAGVDMSRPFELTQMRPGSFRYFIVSDARHLTPSAIVEQNPLMKNYLQPTHWALTGAAGMIHASWLIRVQGLPLPRRDYQLNRWSGQSVLKSVQDDLNRAMMSRAGISQLLDEVNLDIVSVKGLNAAMRSGQKKDIQDRFETYAALKSLFRLVAIDADETVNNRQINMAGQRDILEIMYSLLAGASDIPVTRLIGTSAKGLSATGEGDLRNYYDSVASKREFQLRPILNKCDKIICQDIGMVKAPVFTFPPLWEESGLEKSQRLLTDAQRHQIHLTLSVVSEAAVAKELQQDKVYSFMSDEDIADIEESSKALDETGNEDLNPANPGVPGTDSAPPESVDDKDGEDAGKAGK